MSDDSNSDNNPEQTLIANGVELYRPFSAQPTTLIETSLAGSLGLSMHNEVSNQQSARLASLASTTNACKMILESKLARKQAESPKDEPKASESAEVDQGPPQKPKSRLNLGKFLERKKPAETADASAPQAPASTPTEGSEVTTNEPTQGNSNEPTEQ